MKKIGLLDSGVGGFSLLRDLLNQSLDAEYFFISDNKNVPYGGKSQEFMLMRLQVLVEILLEQKVEAIVIACNTATVQTIDILREKFNIPFIGIEPYINYLNHSLNKNISLILTDATFRSLRFKELQLKYDPNRQVQIFPLKNLALIIEKLFYSEFSMIQADVDEELELITIEKGGCLVLGCTHYPLIKNYIEKKLQIKTIDPNKFVINELIKKLDLESGPNNARFMFCFNADGEWLNKDLQDFNLFY